MTISIVIVAFSALVSLPLLAMEIRLFRRRNFPAFWLGMPYLILSLAWMVTAALDIPKARKRNIVLPQKTRLDLSSVELAAIVKDSKIDMGLSSDLQWLGGVVVHPEDCPAAAYVLKSKGVDVPPDMAMVWILESEPQWVSRHGDSFFVSGQRHTGKGLWLSWIEREAAESIRNVKVVAGPIDP